MPISNNIFPQGGGGGGGGGSTLYFSTFSAFPTIGQINTIYVAKDEATFYIWNGTIYVAESSPTTNSFTTSGNTATSNVNGKSSSAPIINSLSITNNAYNTALTVTANGIASSPVNIVNNSQKLITSNYTLLATDKYLQVDCTSGAITITLPLSTTTGLFLNNTFDITFVNNSTNSATVSTTNPEKLLNSSQGSSTSYISQSNETIRVGITNLSTNNWIRY